MLEIRQSTDGKPGIYGLAAPFYDGTPRTEFVLWDDGNSRGVERIMNTFFDSSLERGDDVMGLFNHDPSYPLGRTKAGTMTLRKTSRGLEYDIPAAPDSRSDVVEMLQRGDVDGSSFAFTIAADEEKREGSVIVFELHEAKRMYDVGPVTYPAYSASESESRGLFVRGISTEGEAWQVRSCDASEILKRYRQRCERRELDEQQEAEQAHLQRETLERRLRLAELRR